MKFKQRKKSLSWSKIVSKITRWQYRRTIKQCRRRRLKHFDDSCPSPALRSTGEKSLATRSAKSSKRNNNESFCITTRCTAQCLSTGTRSFERDERVKEKFAGESRRKSYPETVNNPIKSSFQYMIINIRSAFSFDQFLLFNCI